MMCPICLSERLVPKSHDRGAGSKRDYSESLGDVLSFFTDVMYSRGERFILRLKTLEKYCASG